MLLSNTFIDIYLLLATIINSVRAADIYSHLGRFYHNNVNRDRDASKDIRNEVHNEIEKTFLQFMKTDNNKIDPVCSLTASKKIALCDLVYKIPYYQQLLSISINKVAFYKASLTCEKKKLTIVNSLGQIIIMEQVMYPCHGRHDVVQTSFIEDEFYDKFYLSVGPLDNSIAVYINVNDGISQYHCIYDYIYNMDLLAIQNFFIDIKEILQELKLNKQIFIKGGDIKNLYIKKEQLLKKNTSDPICDLTYEKKISLCNIILTKYSESNILPAPLTLNKAASYIYNMACSVKPVYYMPTKEGRTILNMRQKLFPCYSHQLTNSDTDYLFDKYLQALHVSSGYYQNSVFIYLRTRPNLTEEMFYLLDLSGNINLKNLKPTVLTPSDIIDESHFTYESVKRITDKVEQRRKDLLLSVITSNKSEEEEIKEIQHLTHVHFDVFKQVIKNRKQFGIDYFKYIPEFSEEKDVSSGSKDSDNNELLKPFLVDIMYTTKGSRINEGNDFAHIGSQMYIRLLDKIKKKFTQMKTSSITDRVKKKLIRRKLQKNETTSRTLQIKEEIKKLIKKMEIAVTIHEGQKENLDGQIKQRKTTKKK